MGQGAFWFPGQFREMDDGRAVRTGGQGRFAGKWLVLKSWSAKPIIPQLCAGRIECGSPAMPPGATTSFDDGREFDDFFSLQRCHRMRSWKIVLNHAFR